MLLKDLTLWTDELFFQILGSGSRRQHKEEIVLGTCSEQIES